MRKDMIIICPNEEKEKILEEYSKEESLNNIKFMTKKEFFNNYFFTYNNKTIEYLIKKYKYNIDVCKVYLSYLYCIDINKIYKSNKLNFLKDLKQELINNNLLIENKYFKKYIKNKEIIVKNYYDLDKYEEEILNYKVSLNNSTLNKTVLGCKTLEEEVNQVCLKIIGLINNGVDINNIYLSNINNDYLYTIDKLFKYYNIPINLDYKSTIYSTKVVKDYLLNKTLDLKNKDNLPITKKLINILNDLTDIEDESIYNILLLDKLKSTYIPSIKLDNAVNIKDLYKNTFNENDHVFVLSFNQDILPKMYKDIDYITDKEKEEINMYKTTELNKRNKLVLTNLLSNINNLYLSYKTSSSFTTYYKSSLITDLDLDINYIIDDDFSYSNCYNKLRLGQMLDDYYTFKTSSSNLERLNYIYELPYNTYSNKFTGINKDNYLKFIQEPLNISYSSMNNYKECSFKYYINNVLKIDNYEEKFAQFIGNLYHRILYLMYNENFNIEKEYNYYLENTEYKFDIKDKIFLIKIKKDLFELVDSIKKQELLTGYNNRYLEKKVEIELNNKDIHTVFKGFIDKIMYIEKFNETYYSIIDYKTGTIDTKIEPMKYGLHMQLPTYLYLIRNSRLFTNDKFTGLYYQNILFNYPSSKNKEDLDKEKKNRIKLQGYSTDNLERLELFDTTYENSEYIKSIKYDEEKGFGTYSKVLNDELVDKMYKYTKNMIINTSKDIINAKFDIEPKVYDKKNISCEFCNYKDICFRKDKDIKYLDKVDNLDFLDEEVK